MTHGSVFSGIGAPELAAEWIGWENLFHCELNKWCLEFLNKRFKGDGYSDITKTDFTIWRGLLDVLTGGFPCQDASNAKQWGDGQTGLLGERTALWWHMARAIEESQPTWVVAENVANILRTNRGRDFAQIINELARMGYNAEWKVMYASDFGAPHKRARCYLVAYSDRIRIPKGESFFSHVRTEVTQKRWSNIGATISVGESWPSEPQVCSVDHGLSRRSFEVYGKSRLIEETFHAYGNSMCPQLVHAIFKRINELSN